MTRQRKDIDAEIFEYRQLTELEGTSLANRSWVGAVKAARTARTNAGLDCDYDEHGSAVFTADQGLVATMHTREDAAATLILQRDILIRLDQIRKLCWLIAGGVFLVSIKAWL